MIRPIPRYGVRHVPGSTEAALKAIKSGRGIQGPEIREFERRFAGYHDIDHAIAASYGRMAFYYILRALDLPRGSEIIFPALTFWVVPEIARVCGLKPVFVDIDSRTLNLDPGLIERAIGPDTRAIVPTHLYGAPCDMEPIMALAREHKLAVVEDCAHAPGATYRGARTGTFGDAAFFSFQMLKGLNACGGGMAVTRDSALAARIRALADAEPWPSAGEVRKKILLGELQRGLISPRGFACGLFIGFYVGSFFGDFDLSRILWEKIRPLDVLPESYKRRFSNAQAILGLCGLDNLDAMNARTIANAKRLSQGLRDVEAIVPPADSPDAQEIFYQYCIRASDAATLSRRAIRRGVDIEVMHVDICNKLPLFADQASSCPVAESTVDTLQLPVYSRLRSDDIDRVLDVVREAAKDLPGLRTESKSTSQVRQAVRGIPTG